MPWIGYTRVSRVGDREETLISPDLQRQRIEGWAAANGYEIEMLPPELDESGGKLERPILQRAVDAVERGEYDGIAVAFLSRLSRSLRHSLELFDRIERAGGRIVSVTENIDMGTAPGRLQRNMLMTVADYQLDTYRENFRTAKADAIRRGLWMAPRVPLGYRKNADRRLEPDPEKAPVVRRAFKLRAEGRPWPEVASALGVTRRTAQYIIRSRAYRGEVSVSGHGTNLGAHEPLVDEATWQAAQLPSAPASKVKSLDLLCTGLVRCASCQSTMTPSRFAGVPCYRCHPAKAGGRCQAPAVIRAHLVDDYVEAVVRSHLEELVLLAMPSDTEIAEAEAELEEASAEVAAFIEVFDGSGVDPHLVRAQLARRQARVEAASARLAKAGRDAATLPERDVREALSQWSALPLPDRRDVLRSAVGVVWVARGSGDRIRVVAKGFEPANLSRPGVSGPMTPVPDGVLPGTIRLES